MALFALTNLRHCVQRSHGQGGQSVVRSSDHIGAQHLWFMERERAHEHLICLVEVLAELGHDLHLRRMQDLSSVAKSFE